MKSEDLQIEGMSCGHCVMSVKKELGKLAGLLVEEVKIGSAKVKYDETKVSREKIAAVIEEAGYRLIV